MRYIIYGAGAIGGTIGARLCEAGTSVVLIARGENFRVLGNEGLRFATPDRVRTLRIPVVSEPSTIGFTADDVVILTMKGQDTAAAVDALAAEAPPDLHVVCAQNGVDNERIALRRFAHVHGMCVRCYASHLEPGSVRAFGAPMSGIFDVGRFPIGIDDVDRRIAADFAGACMLSEADPDIVRRKYAKLLSNATNILEAAGGTAVRWSPLRERIRREVVAVFGAAGIAYEIPEESRNPQIAALPIDGRPYVGNSTWQSLERGAPGIEVDALNGEIALLGRLYGVPTPVNAALQNFGHRMVRERIPAGSVSAETLEREVEIYSEQVYRSDAVS